MFSVSKEDPDNFNFILLLFRMFKLSKDQTERFAHLATKATTGVKDLLILSQTSNFTLFQTERVGRHYFTFGENGRKFFKRAENNVGKGKIAHYCGTA